MKRLVRTRHTDSDAGANTHARQGETREEAPCRWNRHICTYMGNIHISGRRYRGLLEFTLTRERARLIDGVWMILNRSRTRVQTAKFGMTQTISYLSYRLILCIMDLIVFAQCFTHAHARTTVKSALFSHLMSSRSITVLRMLSII